MINLKDRECNRKRERKEKKRKEQKRKERYKKLGNILI